MPDRYATPAKGSSDWDVPLNDNFSTLDIDVEHRGTTDPDTAGVTPAAGAKFLDTSTGEIYTADGTSWTLQWDLGAIGSGGGSSDPTTTDGIADVRTHVGPFPQGTYHEVSNEFGIAFECVNALTIQSTVIDVDLSTSNVSSMDIELYPVTSRDNFGIQTGTMVASSSTGTLSSGPQRVPLGFTIPSAGEYALFFNSASRTDANGNRVPARREASWTGWSDYSDLAGDGIDLLQGGIKDGTTNSDYSDYYYYFYDIEVGDLTTSVTSPWSHDVEEIYMRPRDPAEEYDVSPRALWIQT